MLYIVLTDHVECQKSESKSKVDKAESFRRFDHKAVSQECLARQQTNHHPACPGEYLLVCE